MAASENTYFRSGELLSRDDSRLLLVDVQERFVPVISGIDKLIANCRHLLQAAQILGVPVSATEQYPRGLGKTVPQLSELVGDPIEKLRFSSAECLDWVTAGPDDRPKVVVIGIETHVCIQQTVLDLLAAGFSVYIPADAVSSRTEFDRNIALTRMRDSGATITSTEAIVFEWCETAAAPEFKQISDLVKKRLSVDG